VLALLVASLSLLLYVYAGYPLLASLLARAARRPVRKAPGEPHVSLVIVAYNEERDLARKLENTLALDYPSERLEIVVASDGSTDRTDEIASDFAARGVRVFRADDHPGKSGTTSRVVPTLRGEILVFSDATGMYAPDALRALVANFADPEVGAVSGRVIYRYRGSAAAEGFRAYQRMVVAARSAESEWGTETSVSGSICAVRRELFLAIPPHLDYDFAHPLHVAQAGLRTVYEAAAISEEQARERAGSEFQARVRMAVLAFSFVPYWLRALPRVRRAGYLFQFVSHKLLRWLAPLPLLGLLISSASLATSSSLARALLAAQVALYAAAAGALLLPDRARLARLLGPPLFFVTIHAAFLWGLLRWLLGVRVGPWQPEREPRKTLP
jgi:cellulose synthase/poly-beta-1,6-N-acetylglucosamine synthase-like glycosyltransferase